MANKRIITLVLTLWTLTACGADSNSFAPVRDLHQLPGTVQFTEHSYNLATAAPYNRAHLDLLATLADGTPAQALVRYIVRNGDTAVVVDSAGFVTALAPTNAPVVIIAAVTIAGVTLSDSVQVGVVDGVPSRRVDRVVIATYPGDSAVQLLMYPYLNIASIASDGFFKPVDYHAIGTDDAPIDVLLSTSVADSTVAVMVPGAVAARGTGTTWLRVSTFAYGQRFIDSLWYRVDTLRYFQIQSTVKILTMGGVNTKIIVFEPAELTVPVGSDVTFRAPQSDEDGVALQFDPVTGLYAPGARVDVIFDDPSAADVSRIPSGPNTQNRLGGAGNIAFFRTDDAGGNPYGAVARLFTRRGRFAFHNSKGGTGVITVR